MSARLAVTSRMSYGAGQSWAALKKSWRAYKIAKAQGDTPGMLKYAERIRTLQSQLGLPQSHFPEIGLS
jgi:hypothetical protein